MLDTEFNGRTEYALLETLDEFLDLENRGSFFIGTGNTKRTYLSAKMYEVIDGRPPREYFYLTFVSKDSEVIVVDKGIYEPRDRDVFSSSIRSNNGTHEHFSRAPQRNGVVYQAPSMYCKRY